MQPSTPSWRVFDSPVDERSSTGAEPSSPGASHASAIATIQPNVLLALAGLIGALVIGAVAVVVAIGGAGPGAVEGPETGFGVAASAQTASAGIDRRIVVDVAGAVGRPGLYQLAAGARVGDAIDAAGGFSPRVDVDRVGRELNLAASLADGDQVRVPSRDDPSEAPGSGVGTGSGGSDGSGQSGGAGLVNLNSSTQAELEGLPGIGPVTAGKIIAARTEAPFRSVDELRERGLVGEKTFEQIRALVTAG